MALTDQRRSIRIPMPELIVRGRDHTIYAPVYLDGELQVPDEGTVSVYDAANTAIVADAAVAITGDIAQYIITAATTSSLSLEEGWRIEWELTMADGTVEFPRTTAALVRSAIWPVISDVDLIRRCKALDYDAANCITSATDYQSYLDEAWLAIQRRLLRAGNRPNLVVNADALAEPHLYLTLALIFEDLAVRESTYETRAEQYRADYREAWGEIQLEYAEGDDEQVVDRSRAAQPTVWLC